MSYDAVCVCNETDDNNAALTGILSYHLANGLSFPEDTINLPKKVRNLKKQVKRHI